MSNSISQMEAAVLTDECKGFIRGMNQAIEDEREACLTYRKDFQARLNRGELPDFLSSTQSIREGDWQAAPAPADVLDRRVEITGPVDRKMVINGLNSGAKVYMADFEDSNAPTWKNCLQGQMNLMDAVRKNIDFVDPASKKHYKLNDKTAVLMVRPRGWHLLEDHFLSDGKPVSASVFDVGVFLFFNAKILLESGRHPYLYLPKIEHYQEAELWNRLLEKMESALKLPKNSIKVTVLIETFSAVFEMDEIIYSLKDRILGLNCGRWDYIFSFIKQLHRHKAYILPERNEVTMNTPFMKAYVDLLINTCHKRGIHAMGGMAAQIPIKNDEAENHAALEKVNADKLREVRAGHDGTWVAHPGLVSLAYSVFDEHMKGPNQIDYLPKIEEITQAQLMQPTEGKVTEEGIRKNISVALHYLRAWVAGNGCVPVNSLMEDAATAEICRSQLWQWLYWEVPLAAGGKVSRDLLEEYIQQEYEKILETLTTESDIRYLEKAKDLLSELVFSKDIPDFLTLSAYSVLG